MSYTHLEATETYLASGVDLTLPASVPEAERASDAGLAVFPPDPDVDPAQVVEWLVEGTGVAVLGRPAHEFVVEIQRSQVAAEAFGRMGYGVPSPPPHLDVAFGIGGGGEGHISTHSYTWEDVGDGTPSDSRVLEALEETLADESSRTTESN